MTLANLVRNFDKRMAAVCGGALRDRSALLTFLFHGLFASDEQINLEAIDPQQRTTVAFFDEFLGQLKAAGYAMVSPAAIEAGLAPGGRYALITFDDGYFNNTLALPAMEKYNAPAVFFVCPGHAIEQKCFWWDVIYRQRKAQGADEKAIAAEIELAKGLPVAEVEQRLRDEFGSDALTPRGCVDRPMTAQEVRQLARHPLAHIGNHTMDHALLPRCSAAEARRQIASAQESLAEITGSPPTWIAYPNGEWNEQTLEISRALGLRGGLSVDPFKNRLPIRSQPPKMMRLSRFTPRGPSGAAAEALFRSDVRVYGAMRGAIRGWRHRQGD